VLQKALQHSARLSHQGLQRLIREAFGLSIGSEGDLSDSELATFWREFCLDGQGWTARTGGVSVVALLNLLSESSSGMPQSRSSAAAKVQRKIQSSAASLTLAEMMGVIRGCFGVSEKDLAADELRWLFEDVDEARSGRVSVMALVNAITPMAELDESDERLSEVTTRDSRRSSLSLLPGRALHPDAGLLEALGGPATVHAKAIVLLAQANTHHNKGESSIVADVLGNVHCLLGLDDDWKTIEQSLQRMGSFLQEVRYCDQSSICEARRRLVLQRLQNNPSAFRPDGVARTSGLCAALCRWTNAVLLRAGVSEVLPPE
jgi:hypothetical protein